MEPAILKTAVNSAHAPLELLTTLNLMSALWPPQAHVKDNDTFDYIIVGAGVGAVVANRLTENENCQVLLIEAGKNPSAESMLPGAFVELQNSYQEWKYKSEPEESTVSQSHDVFKLSAGKGLGGSSAIGHLVFARGARIDFDSWAVHVKDPSWRYKNVLPYFKKSETLRDEEVMNSTDAKFHGTDGPVIITREPHKSAIKFLKSFEETGYPSTLDINGNSSIGYVQPMYNIGNKVRQSTAEAYLKPIKHRKNLHVLKTSVATKILFDKNKNAIGVIVVLRNGKTITIRVRIEIIVAAGVYNTPKLLMLSGIGPKKELQKLNITVISDLPVGKNMQDHVAVSIGIKLEFSLKISQLPRLVRSPFPIIIGAVSMDKSKNYPEYQTTNLLLSHDTVYMLNACSVLFGYKNKICQKFEDATRWHNHMYSLVALMHPKSRGEVKLRSADPKDPPIIRENFYSNKHDLDNMVRYIEDFTRVINSTYFKKVNAEIVKFKINGSEVEFGSTKYWTSYAKTMSTTLYHATSTCSMGSVVDPELNVYGVKRLRVVDASVMPYITRNNPLATAIMIAEKISDVIKQRNKCKRTKMCCQKRDD